MNKYGAFIPEDAMSYARFFPLRLFFDNGRLYFGDGERHGFDRHRKF